MKNTNNEWPLAEIISIKEEGGSLNYYVHYVDCKDDKFLLYTASVIVFFYSQQEIR